MTIDREEAVRALAGSDEADRIYAAEDLGVLNCAEAAAALLERLPVEPSRAVREAIFRALARIDGESPIAAAVELLDSEDPFLRNQAVELLQTRGIESVPALERSFRQGGRDRRKFVLDALARIAGPATRPIYRKALADPDANVVIAAVENVGNARMREFRADVEALLAPGAHPMLLGVALEALARIGDAASVARAREVWAPEPVPEYLRGSFSNLVEAVGGA